MTDSFQTVYLADVVIYERILLKRGDYSESFSINLLTR